MAASPLEIHRVTPERWDDLVELFGPGGAYGGCWCMWNRETSREFEECKGEENRRRLRQLVADQGVPGLLADRNGTRLDGYPSPDTRNTAGYRGHA